MTPEQEIQAKIDALNNAIQKGDIDGASSLIRTFLEYDLDLKTVAKLFQITFNEPKLLQNLQSTEKDSYTLESFKWALKEPKFIAALPIPTESDSETYKQFFKTAHTCWEEHLLVHHFSLETNDENEQERLLNGSVADVMIDEFKRSFASFLKSSSFKTAMTDFIQKSEGLVNYLCTEKHWINFINRCASILNQIELSPDSNSLIKRLYDQDTVALVVRLPNHATGWVFFRHHGEIFCISCDRSGQISPDHLGMKMYRVTKSAALEATFERFAKSNCKSVTQEELAQIRIDLGLSFITNLPCESQTSKTCGWIAMEMLFQAVIMANRLKLFSVNLLNEIYVKNPDAEKIALFREKLYLEKKVESYVAIRESMGPDFQPSWADLELAEVIPNDMKWIFNTVKKTLFPAFTIYQRYVALQHYLSQCDALDIPINRSIITKIYFQYMEDLVEQYGGENLLGNSHLKAVFKEIIDDGIINDPIMQSDIKNIINLRVAEKITDLEFAQQIITIVGLQALKKMGTTTSSDITFQFAIESKLSFKKKEDDEEVVYPVQMIRNGPAGAF